MTRYYTQTDNPNEIRSHDASEPSLGQLGPQNSPAEGENSSMVLVRGSDSSPDTDMRYSEGNLYVETHTNTAVPSANSVWGSQWKVGGIVSEFYAHDDAEIEGNGGCFRAYATTPPVNPSKRTLVGMSSVGQTNSQTGNWAVFGANIIAAETNGTNAPNCVGIEVDVVHQNSADYTVSPSEGNNYTGYWAQSDANGVYSHTAFYASHTVRSNGWANILRYSGPCHGPMINLKTTENAPDAGGMKLTTFYGGSDGNIINAEVDNGTSRLSDTAFKVTGEINNPVYIKVNGEIKQVLVGAADSGGAGFRQLIVAN